MKLVVDSAYGADASEETILNYCVKYQREIFVRYERATLFVPYESANQKSGLPLAEVPFCIAMEIIATWVEHKYFPIRKGTFESGSKETEGK